MRNIRIKLLQTISILLILLSINACTPTADCGNGVQDGNETAVDCGGNDCPSCGTCSDGIMNGTETAIDCGGSCSSCGTCSDGIMNGSETAIDCGGSCSPCPIVATCSDGIMNGTETAIDCGGSCVPCPVPGSSMHGFYTGKMIGPMVLVYPGVLDIDTNFLSPGIDATYEITASNYLDSIWVELKTTINGTPIKNKVLAHIDSETTYSITNSKYKYLVVNMILNGSGSVNGNSLTANMKMSNGTGNPNGTIINSDLDFTGNK